MLRCLPELLHIDADVDVLPALLLMALEPEVLVDDVELGGPILAEVLVEGGLVTDAVGEGDFDEVLLRVLDRLLHVL